MKKILFLLFTIIFTAALMVSCGEEKIEPVKVSEYQKYVQPGTELTANLPKGWILAPDAKYNRLICYSGKDAQYLFDLAKNYTDPQFNEHNPAAKIELWTKILDSTENYEYWLSRKPWDSSVYSKPAEAMIGNVKGVKYTYEFPIGYEGKIQGEIYYALREDTLGGVLTIVDFSALDNSMKHYKPYFDEVIKSILIAKRPPEAEKKVDSVKPPPSKEFKTFSGDGFTINIPDNFKTEPWNKSKGVIKSYNFMGERRGDCNILVDILPPQPNKSAADVAKDLAKKIRGASTPKPMKVGNQNGFVYAYVPRNDAQSQAYIVKKGDQPYRITINWFTGKNKITGEDEGPLYQDIFIRSAKSFIAK